MAQPAEVTVKPLAGAQNLEGAFRLHLTPDTFEQAGLKLGDLAELNNGDGTTIGVGIAWRAADRARSGNPSGKPVFTSEILRTAYDIPEGQRLTVRKTATQQSRASKVFLRDVTPPENVTRSVDDIENRRWKIKIASLLASLEAFANGVTFDITAKNKAKRRFQVTSISSPNTGCSLYYIDDDTEVVVDESSATTDVTPATASATGRLLTRDHIGGLVDQLRNLNQRMQRVLDDIHKPRVKALGLLINRGILLHGFEGTGRTFVLDQLGQAPFQRVLRLDASYLAGGAAKMQDKIKNLFQEAKANQPSLILADDLQLIVSPSEHAVAAFLAKEMRTIHGQRVLVVATCRTPSELHTKLLDPGCLPVLVELPIPDLSARNKILDIMLRTEETQPGLAAAVSLRTHGFTGKDLKLLADRAKELAHTHPEERITSLTNSVDSNAPSADHQDHSGPNGLHETDDPDDLDGATVLTMESFELALIDIKPTALREIIFEKPKIGWADIGGSDDTKKHFDKALDWPIHHADILKKYNKRPPKGILLYGPPGCSKTLTAQAVASHYGLNFIAVKGGELISMYVGESERKIRELFSKARQAAPCVIFFDEIDSIASERQSDSSKGLNVLTTLLTEMDGFEALSGVLVLAATNKPDLLDAAIMRPGRFGMHVYLGPPNAAARREIFAIGLKGKPVEEGLDIDKLVDISDGYSGAEIAQICENAIDQAIQREVESEARTLCMNDLETAIAKQKRSITADDLASFKAFSAG